MSNHPDALLNSAIINVQLDIKMYEDEQSARTMEDSFTAGDFIKQEKYEHDQHLLTWLQELKYRRLHCKCSELDKE